MKRRSLRVLAVACVLATCGCGSPSTGDADRGDALEDVPADIVDAADFGPPDTTGTDADGDLPLPDGDAANADALPGDSEGDDTALDAPPDVPPDPAFFHAVREPLVSFPDEGYLASIATLYRTVETLPDLDVRAIAVAGGRTWAGTPSGLYALAAGATAFVPVPLGDTDVAIRALAPAPDGLAVATEGRVLRLSADGNVVFTCPAPAPVTGLAVSGATVYATTAADLVACTAQGSTVVVSAPAGATFTGLALTDGRAWLATGAGLHVLDLVVGAWTAPRTAAFGDLPDDDVRAVAADGTRVVAGCATGVSVIDLAANDVRILVPGKGALPAASVRSIAVLGDRILAAHDRGATLFDPDLAAIHHYVSQRYVPDDVVAAVALDPQGTPWLATARGASSIAPVPVTLAAKADRIFAALDADFWRMDGFIASDLYLDDPWTPTVRAVGDADNDGLWTQMGVGALCYAYAVTKDEKYYAAARKAMDTLFLEIDVPAGDFEAAGLGRGFITRSLVRDDEGALFEAKKTDPRWHLATYEGRQYCWKDDTSSDETAGHFFGFPLFYDLCAKTDEERAAVAEHAGALADYIRRNGFVLKDLDGVATSFGHWEPDHVSIAVDGLAACFEAGYELEACGEAAFGAGWLNGLEILGHMLAAWHMTGDAKFLDAYETLVTTHRYGEVVMFTDQIATVANHHIANHSDHELAMLAYATLIRYEPSDARRAKWIESLLGFYAWESGGVPGAGNERQPLWTAFVSLAVAGEARVADGVRSLREYPEDMRMFRVDNSHRKDAADWPDDRFDEPQFDTVFPYDEIRPMWWNGNPYGKVEGGDGRSVQGPAAWLLAYWASRYAGIVE